MIESPETLSFPRLECKNANGDEMKLNRVQRVVALVGICGFVAISLFPRTEHVNRVPARFLYLGFVLQGQGDSIDWFFMMPEYLGLGLVVWYAMSWAKER